MKPRTKSRGFASLDPKYQKQIASRGGKSAHQKGTAHEFTHEEAVLAGKKGGLARPKQQPSELEGLVNEVGHDSFKQ